VHAFLKYQQLQGLLIYRYSCSPGTVCLNTEANNLSSFHKKCKPQRNSLYFLALQPQTCM